MKIINAKQGSSEWHELRRKYHTASQAPAMMGVGHISRSELLRTLATGISEEPSDFQKAMFEKGHEIEALARPIAESIVGEELYPVTGVCNDEYLLASFDGMTMAGDIIWECKSLNAEKVSDIADGDCPEIDYWQVVHQLAVSGATKCLYMVTDGTEANAHKLWIEPIQDDMDRLIAGWQQFDEDLANYEHHEDPVEVVGKAPEQLPALRIEVKGAVTASNLAAFRDRALAVFDGINTDLQTDSDFADAEKTAKWCKEVESKLDAAKDHALSQTASIDELFRAIDQIKAEARDKRLELEKLVKSRKDSIRREIVADGRSALAQHVEGLNKCLSVPVPVPAADFAAAIKGKRTISSLRDAADTLLAQAKIEANAAAELIRANIKIIDDAGHPYLFNDRAQMALRDSEWVAGIVKLRIAEHQEAEQRRLEAERERIRAEEERKAQMAAAEEERRKAEAEAGREVTGYVAAESQPAGASGAGPSEVTGSGALAAQPAAASHGVQRVRAVVTLDVSVPAGWSHADVERSLRSRLATAGVEQSVKDITITHAADAESES